MGGELSVSLAFIAGLLSFISPCVLPLIPAYVGYMGGQMAQTAVTGGPQPQRTLGQRFHVFTHGVFFVLGFTLFFVVFGLLTTAAVSSLTALGVTEGEVRLAIARVGGTVVILFGLHVLGVLNKVIAWLMTQAAKLDRNPYGNIISLGVALGLLGLTYWLFVESWFMTLVVVLLFTQFFNDALKAETPAAFWQRVLARLQMALYLDTRRQERAQGRYGYLSSLFMGVVFSAGWTPCIGPIYGAVLTLASSGGSMSEAGSLLTAYSLGLGIPFLLTALALDQAQSVFRRLQRNMRTIEAVSGVFLIAVGLLVFSGELQRLSVLGNQGRLGELSINMETCVVGATEGRVRWRNVPNCVWNGPKDDFYIAFNKQQPTAADGQAAVAVAALPNVTSDGLAAPAPAIPSLEDEETLAQLGLEAPLAAPAPPITTTVAIPSLESLAPPAQAPEAQAPSAEVAEGLYVGDRAPNFTARTLDGQTVSLSDFRGRVVLLNFWATWCTSCQKEIPILQALYELHQPDFVVLAVNYKEGEGRVRAFAEENGMGFPVLLDPDGTINEEIFGEVILGYPTSLLLDRNGVIAAYFPGELNGAQLADALQPLLEQ